MYVDDGLFSTRQNLHIDSMGPYIACGPSSSIDEEVSFHPTFTKLMMMGQQNLESMKRRDIY